MKKLLFFLIFLPILGCTDIVKNKEKYIDFNCPRIFFSSNDKIFINTINNSPSLEDVFIKAKFDNYSFNNKCLQKNQIAIIPIDILLIAEPLEKLSISKVNIPVYISLLDQYDNLLETQYFMVSGSIMRDTDSNEFVETDIVGTPRVITKNLNVTQLVIGFMLDNRKKELLN